MKYQFAIVALLVSFEAFCQGQFQKESAGSLTYVSGQVMMLAQAIPGDKYSLHRRLVSVPLLKYVHILFQQITSLPQS